MGIDSLLPFLKEATTEIFIGDYKGKTATVDASCWLHKALTISVQRTGYATRYELAMSLMFVVIVITALSAWNNGIYHASYLKNELSCLIFIYNSHSHLGICMGYLELLLRRGVKPFVVFGGFPLPAKLNEQEERKR